MTEVSGIVIAMNLIPLGSMLIAGIIESLQWNSLQKYNRREDLGMK